MNGWTVDKNAGVTSWLLAAWYPKVHDYRALLQNTIRSKRSKLEKETVRRLFVFFRPVVLIGLQSRQDKRGARETGGLGWLRRFKPGSPGQFCAGNLCIVSFVPLLSRSDPGPGSVLSAFREEYFSREICINLVLIRRHSTVSTFPRFFLPESYCL